MGIWDAMAKAACGIKGFLSDLFLKMKILFSSVLNNIRAAVSDLVKIAGNTWKLLKDLLRGLLLRLRKAKKAMGIWGAMDNTEGDIKGFLLGFFLKILFSSILNIILDSVSDPDIKEQIAIALWKLLDHFLEQGTLRFTGWFLLCIILIGVLFSVRRYK
ncbi:hypothetical protein KFK09_002184 [Dendrobium nobile]|uniref:Uncharacterized protein n=1 Tax=Dendrobium nobile TaxID=94219 RepID=A0A8T3C736_DENNO|nr:hypothetical protein KFK09_002184 [Dendrobium nobile]